MLSQISATHPWICYLSPLNSARPKASFEFSPRDGGYEIDEDELASGILGQQHESLTGLSIPEVDPEEFESVYGWFLS